MKATRNGSAGSAILEVTLARSKYDSLVQRFGEASIPLHVARGRFTAVGVWLRLEIKGDQTRIDHARRLCRLSS
ncbi:MAG TPA: hypothetical protein VMU54_01550 [Planctomycetota bacterium]|nr:hypothetical protein [Planctomycetota bacterium]